MASKGLFLVVFVVWIYVTVVTLAAETEIGKGRTNAGSDSGNLKGLRNGNESESHLGSGSVEGKKTHLLNNDTNGIDKERSGNGLSTEKHDVEDKGTVLNKSLGSREMPNVGSKGEGLGFFKSGNGKKGAEVCDKSHSCVDGKNKLMACLRIPGDESLDLSLLVQNKGTGSLAIDIRGPEYVQLETKKVLLQKGESKKVSVSFGEVSNDTTIVLKAGDGLCNLDFKDFVRLRISGQRNIIQPRLAFNGLLTFCGILFLVVAVLTSIIWIYFLLRKRSAMGYEKVDADHQLPVSTGGKPESDWNVVWDDNWDEEAAPTTPSKPFSTLSSKSLAPRKFNKDSGKDN